MAVITFRKPEDGLEHYKLLTELVTILQDIKNPDTINTVKELSKELTAAQEISDSKKKELQDAEEIIAQSKEFIEDFEKDKADHAEKIAADLNEIQMKTRTLNSDISSFASEKEQMQKLVEKTKAESGEALTFATAQLEAAAKMQKETQQQILELGTQRTEHKKALAEFESNREETIKDFEAKTTKYEEDVNKLAEDREAFEVYKNKFYAILKENA